MSASVWDELGARHGIAHAPQPPDDIVAIPTNITELPDADLMRLLARYNSWANYLADVLVDATALEADAKFDLTMVTAHAAADSGAGSVAARNAAAILDPAVVITTRALLDVGNKVRLIKTAKEKAERNANNVSRELSRRVAGRDREARDIRWGT